MRGLGHADRAAHAHRLGLAAAGALRPDDPVRTAQALAKTAQQGELEVRLFLLQGHHQAVLAHRDLGAGDVDRGVVGGIHRQRADVAHAGVVGRRRVDVLQADGAREARYAILVGGRARLGLEAVLVRRADLDGVAADRHAARNRHHRVDIDFRHRDRCGDRLHARGQHQRTHRQRVVGDCADRDVVADIGTSFQTCAAEDVHRRVGIDFSVGRGHRRDWLVQSVAARGGLGLDRLHRLGLHGDVVGGLEHRGAGNRDLGLCGGREQADIEHAGRAQDAGDRLDRKRRK